MNDVKDTDSKLVRWVWRTSLVFFIIAGLTGVLYRFSLAYGWTAGLQLVNIRHAHSHLMYFGWVTPVLFALIARHLSHRLHQPLSRNIPIILAACFAAALIAYPLFLLFGYTPVSIGAKRMPVAVIAATLNMVGWYFFVAFYVKRTCGVPRTRALLFWDMSLTFLVMATLGAGALAFLKPLGIQDDVLTSALTHVFLDYFSEGWFVLAVLGIIYSELPTTEKIPGNWTVVPLALGLPLTFALGMPSVLVPPTLQVVSRIGGFLVGAGLLVHVVVLWPRLNHWRIPIFFLGLKAFSQVVLVVTPGAWWANTPGMRVLYLHVMLLGFVSLGLMTAAMMIWGREAVIGRKWMTGAVFLLIATLIPLTTLWPATWRGPWIMKAALVAAILPVLAATVMAIFGTVRSHSTIPIESKSTRREHIVSY